ncbi:MAG: BlaI/MecI/CopY family transcriptional regulator [Planctomycetes bacterium]|nr:BlaI/MecI/CopY family transcriptional regulator [Planctomycetota bacterium]
MTTPDEPLTATQLEVLQAVQQLGPAGGTAAEVWQAIIRHKDLARTTVLTWLQRLEKKGWLRRRDDRDGVRYFAVCSRAEAEQRLARRFVADYFAGSTPAMVKSLLGDGRIDRDDLRRLKEILAAAEKR